MFRAMAVSAGFLTFAVASDWCRSGYRADGEECVDIIEAFMEDVLEMPKTLSGRRLLSADDITSHVEGVTIGEQFAFLVDVAIHGNRTSAGWHLNGGRRLHSAAANKMANLIDMMQEKNDKGCHLTKLSRRQAENDAFKDAAGAVADAMSSVKKSKQDNIKAQNVVRGIGKRHHLMRKIIGLLKGSKVMGVITGNLGVVGTAVRAVSKLVVPIVNGLKWMGNKVLGFFGLYDTRPVAATMPSKFSSTANSAKLFSLMAAGMITLFAAAMVGLRHGKKLGTFMKSPKERNGLSDDKEYVITGTSE